MKKIILEITFDDSNYNKSSENKSTTQIIKDNIEKHMQIDLQHEHIIKEGWEVKVVQGYATPNKIIEAFKDTHNLYVAAIKDRHYSHDITRIMSNEALFKLLEQ